MISTIKVHDEDGNVVGQEVVSGELILKSAVTEDGTYSYTFNTSDEVNRLIMVCPEEGELFYQVVENIGVISNTSGSEYILDNSLLGKLSKGAELFLSLSSTATDIGDAEPVSGKTYILNGAVVSNGKDGKIIALSGDVDGFYAYNFYNGKTSKLIASLPLVSSYHSTNTTNTVSVKFNGLDDRKVKLYFVKEG